MDYNQKSTRPVDLVFGEAQSGNLNNKDVPTRDNDKIIFCQYFDMICVCVF